MGRSASSDPRGNAPASSGARVDALCSWCSKASATHTFCSQRCRQAAFRVRRRRATEEAADRPMRFAYADPPYPGLAAKPETWRACRV